MSESQDEHDDFFRLVGMCVTTWSGIESKLFRICRIALQTEKKLAAIVFFRAPTFSARLALVDELLKAALSNEDRNGTSGEILLKEWAALQKHMAKMLEFRNRLAHDQVSGKGDGTGSWIEIHSKVNESWRGKKSGYHPIRLHDLVKHHKDLDKLLDQSVLCMRKVIDQFPKLDLPK